MQRKGLVRRVLLVLLLGFLLLNAVAFFHAWRFTHFTADSGQSTGSPEQLTLAGKLWVLATGVRTPKPRNHARPAFPYATVRLAGPNGQLESWYGAVPRAQGTVAMFHGYTSSKSQLLHEAGYFRSLGYNVLLTDFAGSGNSQGYRCTVGYDEADDVATTVRWLQRRPRPVFIYANSMGAVATLRAEAELGLRPTANLLECPYGSMLATAQSRFRSMDVPACPMANLLVFWGGAANGFNAFDLDATAYAARTPTPTLLFWGTADPRVTPAETAAIFAQLAGPKQRQDFPGSGHEPYWWKHEALWQRTVAGFLAEHNTNR